MIKTLAPLALAFSCLLSDVTGVMAQNAPPNVVKELAPNGKLRAAINFGNIVLAQRTPRAASRAACPWTLARELAKRLGVPIESSSSTPPARCWTRSRRRLGHRLPGHRPGRARAESNSPRPT